MKKQITLRIDEDVLDWFRGRGKGYQSHINKALRFYVENFRGVSKIEAPTLILSDDVPEDTVFIIDPDKINIKGAPDPYFIPMPKKGKK